MSGSSPAENISLPPLSLVIGGARSGKSRLAEGLVARLAAATGAPRVYLATAEARDPEMAARIALHRARRQGWATIEAPQALAAALAAADPAAAVLIDCATLWLSNRMLAGADLAAEEEGLMAALAARQAPVVVVSNEVGQGIVPDNALARAFRDAQGRLNQRLAAAAGLVVLAVAGLPLVVRGQPPGGAW